MRSLGSFLVCISTLAAYRSEHPMSPRLRWYCLITVIHGFVQGILLLAIPISSRTYGFEWYLARSAQVVVGVTYLIEVGRRSKLKASWSAAAVLGLMFGVVASPETWFNWLAFVYALPFLVMGTVILPAKDQIARIMGVYWCAMGCWQFVFSRLSMDPASIIWSLNWWLPSTISVSTFLLLASGHRFGSAVMTSKASEAR